jgi:thioredoxin-like negative regulator of GroEL
VARAHLADEEVEAAESTIREGLEALPGDQQLALQLALMLDGKRQPKEALEVLGSIEPSDEQVSSPRLIYDVWEPADMQDIRTRLRNDAALGLPILGDKLGARAPVEVGE